MVRNNLITSIGPNAYNGKPMNKDAVELAGVAHILTEIPPRKPLELSSH